MKNKYFLHPITLVFIFLVSVVPVLASEITAKSVREMVNESRESIGLEALAENEKLTQAANAKLNDMIANNYFAHTSPAGIEPWHWFEESEYDYQFAGENLAINFLTTEAQHKAWMKSPTHKKNILNSNYSEIGVAVGAGEINGQMSIIAVQEFGTRIGEANLAGRGSNFSAAKNKNLIEEGNKIVPQVLSVRSASQNRNDVKLEKELMAKKVGFLDGVVFLLAFLFLLSIVGSPLALVFYAEKMASIWNNKNKGEAAVSM